MATKKTAARKTATRKPAQKAAPAPATEAPPIIAYKGFDAHWTCRGMQYAIGETFEHTRPAVASGRYGAATASGEKSCAFASGRNGKARASKGGAIFLTYRDDDWNIVHARASKVGENGVKADVWYSLDAAGEFVEVAA